MADKRMSNDFAASDGKRELEIFLLADAARKELRKMDEQAAKERDDLRKRQDERRERDIEAARKEIAARKPRPELAPPWKLRDIGPKASEIQVLAERLVDTRNEKESRGLHYAQRQRVDDFLTKQKEERLLRESADRSRTDERRDGSQARRDLDKAPDRDRDRER